MMNLGDDTCFVPIFGQTSSSKTTWFLGNIFLSQYYTVFDMSTLDRGFDHIRVGMAPINPSDDIGQSLIDKFREKIGDSEMLVYAFFAFVIFLILLGVYCFLKKRKGERRGIFEERNFVEYDFNEEDAVKQGFKKQVD
mmetsp:Transcript_5551/g.9503  ORF Transcript_5551/g.9503 Transcript_5551/m.9503 type:complete len:138 (+) Transcript_5551:1125-1538(+)